MANLKTTTEALVSWLKGHSAIEEVTLGDVNEVDLSTRTDFPLAHIIPLNTDFSNIGLAGYRYQVLFLDKFQDTLEDKIEVLSEQSITAGDFISALNKGYFFDFPSETTVGTAEVMYDQLSNRLYGYSVEITVVSARPTIC